MRRHQFDPLSFVFGAVIASIGFAFLTGHVDLTDLRLTWVWPIPIMVLGLLMLVSARRQEGTAEPATGSAPTPTGTEGAPAAERSEEREETEGPEGPAEAADPEPERSGHEAGA